LPAIQNRNSQLTSSVNMSVHIITLYTYINKKQLACLSETDSEQQGTINVDAAWACSTTLTASTCSTTTHETRLRLAGGRGV